MLTLRTASFDARKFARRSAAPSAGMMPQSGVTHSYSCDTSVHTEPNPWIGSAILRFCEEGAFGFRCQQRGDDYPAT